MSLFRKVVNIFSKKSRNKQLLEFHFKENAFLVKNSTIISSNKNEHNNISDFSYYYVKYKIGHNIYYD
jgi:hypothetical protein